MFRSNTKGIKIPDGWILIAVSQDPFISLGGSSQNQTLTRYWSICLSNISWTPTNPLKLDRFRSSSWIVSWPNSHNRRAQRGHPVLADWCSPMILWFVCTGLTDDQLPCSYQLSEIALHSEQTICIRLFSFCISSASKVGSKDCISTTAWLKTAHTRETIGHETKARANFRKISVAVQGRCYSAIAFSSQKDVDRYAVVVEVTIVKKQWVVSKQLHLRTLQYVPVRCVGGREGRKIGEPEGFR